MLGPAVLFSASERLTRIQECNISILHADENPLLHSKAIEERYRKILYDASIGHEARWRFLRIRQKPIIPITTMCISLNTSFYGIDRTLVEYFFFASPRLTLSEKTWGGAGIAFSS